MPRCVRLLRSRPLGAIFVTAVFCMVSALPACASGPVAQFSYATTDLGGGFSGLVGVAVDASGNVYAVDSGNAVKEIPPGCVSASCVTTLGGGLASPQSVAVDASGNVYVVEGSTAKAIPAGCASASCVTTLGGGFAGPAGVAVDAGGNVYVADPGKNAVKEMPPGCASASCVTTLGGGFSGPYGVAVDASGNVYVADAYHNAVKEMPPGCASASCVTALGGGFSEPYGVAVDAGGNVYVADYGNHAVKEMPPGCASASCVATLLGGFSSLQNLAVDGNGNVYAADYGASTVKEIATAVDFYSEAVGTASAVHTFTFSFNTGVTLGPPDALTLGAPNLDFAVAGGGTCVSGATFSAGNTCTANATFTPKFAGERNGAIELTDSSATVIATAYVHGIGSGPQAAFDLGTAAVLGGGFSGPNGVAVDASGNVYVTDTNNNAVKKIPPGCVTASCVTVLGGGFSNPYGVAVDGSGNVYVADFLNNAVKEIPPGCTTSSCVKTLGGGFSNPYDVAVDASGNIYVANPFTGVVNEMPPGCASASCVKTLGGGFSNPGSVAVDASGNIYVTDYGNNAVKEIPPGCTTSSCVKTLNGGFSLASYVAVDGSGNLYVADYNNNAVTEIQRASPPALSFASTDVGSTSSDSPRTVTVENIGNQALTFPIPTSSGAYNPSVPANFSYSNTSTCLQNGATAITAFTLAAGSSCTVVIDFEPAAAGSISGDVVLTDDSGNAAAPSYTTQEIQLSGTGVQTVTNLAFTAGPPATVTAGGNAGTVTVAEQDSGGTTVTAAADSITLTVTGPSSYSKTYTETAASGVATFNLSSVTLSAAGSYSYAATSGGYQGNGDGDGGHGIGQFHQRGLGQRTERGDRRSVHQSPDRQDRRQLRQPGFSSHGHLHPARQRSRCHAVHSGGNWGKRRDQRHGDSERHSRYGGLHGHGEGERSQYPRIIFVDQHAGCDNADGDAQQDGPDLWPAGNDQREHLARIGRRHSTKRQRDVL